MLNLREAKSKASKFGVKEKINKRSSEGKEERKKHGKRTT